MTESGEYLRAGDIARVAGVSVRTVRRWIAARELPSIKIGGTRLVARAELGRLLSPMAEVTEEIPEQSNE